MHKWNRLSGYFFGNFRQFFSAFNFFQSRNLYFAYRFYCFIYKKKSEKYSSFNDCKKENNLKKFRQNGITKSNKAHFKTEIESKLHFEQQKCGSNVSIILKKRLDAITPSQYMNCFVVVVAIHRIVQYMASSARYGICRKCGLEWDMLCDFMEYLITQSNAPCGMPHAQCLLSDLVCALLCALVFSLAPVYWMRLHLIQSILYIHHTSAEWHFCVLICFGAK